MAPRINLIVAVCENFGIGVSGNLPWRLKSELAFFKRMTLSTQDAAKKNMVIMGRRTWDSIPEKFRPLPGRVNVILSRQPRCNNLPQDVQVFSSFEAVVDALQQESMADKIETAWVIGGSSVYQTALKSPFCHRVYLTKINKSYDCDTFLEPIEEEYFTRVQDPAVPQDTQVENDTTFDYIVYERISGTS
ncbi:dihydrofolate reductase [Thrips palmi]|uniref:dihydrofolate reductase n=1 Tax=Thrips palmi TaxID=161013 RepID=A0A6P8ZLZ4_THRPL|nr:dihydrofolate reductase [Thrips palmi]